MEIEIRRHIVSRVLWRKLKGLNLLFYTFMRACHYLTNRFQIKTPREASMGMGEGFKRPRLLRKPIA